MQFGRGGIYLSSVVRPLAFAACFLISLSACNQKVGTAPPPPVVGGNNDIYGGTDPARRAVLHSLDDLDQVYGLLEKSPQLKSELCPEYRTLVDTLHASVRAEIERATEAQRLLAREVISLAAPTIRQFLDRDFEDLVDLSSEKLENKGHVLMKAPIGTFGPVQIAWGKAGAVTLNELDMAFGHDLHHMLPETLFTAALDDGAFGTQTLPASSTPPLPNRRLFSSYFTGNGAGFKALTLIGACLAAFAERRAYRQDHITYVARGSAVIYNVVFKRRDGSTEIVPSTATPPAAVGTMCPANLSTVGCMTPRVLDRVLRDGKSFTLSSAGQILDSDGVTLATDTRIISFGYGEDRWYVLRRDGTVLSGFNLQQIANFRAIPGLRLPQAQRLAMPGDPPL